MKQLHNLQLQILKKLLFATELRYTELKPDKQMDNNQFDFHLDQLIKGNYIQKNNAKYSLTKFGKEYANRMDTVKTKITQQAKISMFVCCTKTIDSKQHYLIYTRLKQPFYGCQGFFSGKVDYGERVIDAVRRELKEETNLEGEPILLSLKHYRVIDPQNSEILEDKFMFFCHVNEPTGELIPHIEGQYEWVSEDNIYTYVTNPFESMEDFRSNVQEVNNFKSEFIFKEIEHSSDKF